METVVSHGSPLEAYLEGKGELDTEYSQTESPWTPHSPTAPSFAPQGPPDVLTALRKRHVGIVAREPPFSILRSAGAAALNSTLGRADNERFLEHFRYTIIGSQLLQEHAASGLIPSHNITKSECGGPARGQPAYDLKGAGLSAFVAFGLVWTSKQAYYNVDIHVTWSELALVSALLVVLGVVVFAYTRRHLLLYLRRRAIDVASDFVTNAQTFGSVTTTILTLIQEVELVSRGYRVTSPLSPISRIEGDGLERQCGRLRRNLHGAFSSVIPALGTASNALRSLTKEDDLDRYLEVYDIRVGDVHDAMQGIPDVLAEGVDAETLSILRALQHRYNILRRLFLCSLLSLPATGRKEDVARWRVAISEMESVNAMVTQVARDLQNLLTDEERFVDMSANLEPAASPSPNQERVHSQIRRISALSTGIKSLQAKMYLLREESARALSKSSSDSEVAAISVSLREQYDAVGSDLKTLMQAWEAGKAALGVDITRHERRVSRRLSGLPVFEPGMPSPTFSSSSFLAVDETGPRLIRRGSPNSALRTLNGETPLPLSPPATDHGDNGSISADDDEVFEAVAVPRLRNAMSREQRIAKMREDREKQLTVNDQKDASTRMMRELESVINLRPLRRNTSGRITSL